MNPFTGVTAAFVAFLIAVGPSAAMDTKAVDFIRGLIDKSNTKPGWLWIALATVGGLVIALAFELNFVGPLVLAIPALAKTSSRLTGTAGQVLTGLGIAGSSSYWHHVFALKAAKTAEANSNSSSAT